MNRWWMLIVLILLALALIFTWFHTAPSRTDRTEVRAAMDIGSGATNLKVAEVNVDTDKIMSVIFEQSIPVPYQKHLEQSTDTTFDRQVMAQGLEAIRVLKEAANRHQAKKVIAVATAAFRKAVNAPQFAQEIERETGVQVRIIDQDEEGILAFRGALAVSPVKAEDAVVWDIGGGSMQLTTLTEGGTYLVDKGKTASIPFKNTIIQEVKRENPQYVQSPNPISEENAKEALKYARQAALATNPYVLDKLHRPSTQVLAVGSLFNYAILPLAGQAKVDPSHLVTAVEGMIGKTDQELPGGSLAEVAVSNPLLVLGYMQALEIPYVNVLSVNNADGALTYDPYWEEEVQPAQVYTRST